MSDKTRITTEAQALEAYYHTVDDIYLCNQAWDNFIFDVLWGNNEDYTLGKDYEECEHFPDFIEDMNAIILELDNKYGEVVPCYLLDLDCQNNPEEYEDGYEGLQYLIRLHEGYGFCDGDLLLNNDEVITELYLDLSELHDIKRKLVREYDDNLLRIVLSDEAVQALYRTT